MKAKAKKSAKKSFSSFVSSLTRRTKSSSPTRAAAKGEEEDLSSSPTRAAAKGEEEDLSSSPTRAAAKGEEEDLSSSPIQFNKKIFKNQAP